MGVVAMNNTAVRIVALVLCLATAPFAAEAQKTGKVYRIGVLDPAPAAPNTNLDAFRQGLRELGYVEGQNLVIEVRSPAGRPGVFPDLAAELVRSRSRNGAAAGGRGDSLASYLHCAGGASGPFRGTSVQANVAGCAR
jgi:hypothetical protein